MSQPDAALSHARLTSPSVDSDGLHTLGRWTSDRARATPDRVAVDDRGVCISYAELDRRATALARAFVRAGLGVGSRVATITGNSSDHVVVFFACAKAGAALVPLSWRLSPRELAEQLVVAEPAILLVEDEFRTLSRSVATRLARTIPTTGLGSQGVEAEIPTLTFTKDAAARQDVRDDDPLLIIFTSGTTGTARGAVLTHANCFWTNVSLSRIAEITSHDVVLAMMPEYHVGGWNIQPLLAWWQGATVVLERTFDPARVLHLIAERGITTMMGVPTNYLFLSQHPDFEQADLSTLRHAIVGGAPMPAPLLRAWHARGVALTQGYGLTEASPNVLCLANEDARRRLGSAGKPYPHVDVALADPVTGELLDGAARGELLVRGPGVFAGYFRDPEASRLALRGGWLHTGDMVDRDAEGFYTIVDRLGDIFISGGESIAPAEVESVLAQHPAVADVAVVGVADQRWGEVGVAWIVVRRGATTDDEDLRAHASRSLARYKVPSQFRFVAAIPRSASSKVLRRHLLKSWVNECETSGTSQ